MKKINNAAFENIVNKASLQHDRSFIINDNTSFPIREEYKTLRTNIMFSIPSEGCKVIGITSAEPMEGKSINCLNLAITFAQTNARVLIIDCDLRLPTQASLLALDAVPGISNILVGMNTIEEAIHKTSYSDLNVILSGDIPPNPSELLGSENMGKVIDKLSNYYDYIFIDLPPINTVSDALVMTKYISGLILIIKANTSKRANVIKAISQLELVNANVIGVVLNGVKNKMQITQKSYSKYSRYRKYGYAEASCEASNLSRCMVPNPVNIK